MDILAYMSWWGTQKIFVRKWYIFSRGKQSDLLEYNYMNSSCGIYPPITGRQQIYYLPLTIFEVSSTHALSLEHNSVGKSLLKATPHVHTASVGGDYTDYKCLNILAPLCWVMFLSAPRHSCDDLRIFPLLTGKQRRACEVTFSCRYDVHKM